MSDAAQFLPQRNDDERPAVQVGEVLVFVYTDEDETVRVTVDTEDVTAPTYIDIKVNSGTVWEGSA